MDQREDPTGDTFDYGLAPGETYEPETIEEIDRSQPHIMTVLGPVEPGALGVTNAAASFATFSADPAAILTEIEEARFVGLNALVHLDPITTAAEAETARWLAGRCDLHLIVTTGPDAGDPIDSIGRAIETGIAGSGVFPGAIVTTLEPGQLISAAAARRASGLPLIVRAEPDASGEEIMARLHQTTIDPNGLVVAGEVNAPEPLLEAGGALLIAIDRRDDAPAAARQIAGLVDQSFVDQILVGFNPQPAADPVSYLEGSRWSWLIEQFPLLLLDAGLNAMTVRTLMIENPNRWLTTYPPVTTGSSEETS